MAVPAYFYPGTGWNAAVAAEPGVDIMVANVNSGPGTGVDATYGTAISRAQSAGITLYGIRAHQLRATLDGGSGVGALTAFVHQQAAGSQTIVNFGTIPPQSQMSAGDIAVTFEGDYSSYQGLRFPSWVSGFAPSRFYNIIYGVPNQTSMSQVMSEAAANRVGYVYATSYGLPNPYDGLPAYLTAETGLAHTGC